MLHPERQETWVSLGAGSAQDRLGGGWKGRGIVLSHENKPRVALGAVLKVSFLKGLLREKGSEKTRGEGTANAAGLRLGLYSFLVFRMFFETGVLEFGLFVSLEMSAGSF